MVQIKDILDKEEAGEVLEKMGFTGTKRIIKELQTLVKTPFCAYLDAITAQAACSPSAEDAVSGLAALAGVLSKETLEKFLKEKRNLARLITLCASSPYLTRFLINKPEWFSWLFFEGGLKQRAGEGKAGQSQDLLTEELRLWSSAASSFDEYSTIIRSFRNREYLRLGLRDLLHLGTMQEITAGLSDLAGACLEVAHSFCLDELITRHGEPVYTSEDGIEKTAGFSIIALGKLGGGELNFCSDIDLLYIYTTEKGESRGVEGRKKSALDLHTFFQKLGRQITKMISTVTEDGFVFRVDLDLRPEGRSGELVNSLRSAEVYYESWGRTWERSAMIKARPVAGSKELGKEFLKMIRPFVYRRSIDFTALEEIKTMKERIDIELLRRSPDAIDVKLGEGGIREIEFFCQALQLIYGGKDPEIRERSTMAAIDKLKDKDLLKGNEAGTLKKGYIYLRDLEHRIQIVEGRQSQAIPLGSVEVERLARMMGFKGAAGQTVKGPTGTGAAGTKQDKTKKTATELFQKSYIDTTARIYRIYKTLFYGAENELQKETPKEIYLLFSELKKEELKKGLPEEIYRTLEGLGFSPTQESLKKIKLLRDGPDYLRIPPSARAMREKIAPYLAAKAALAPDPDMALTNTERFLSTLGGRRILYALLGENPKLTALLIRVFGSSLYLSNALIERPENLEILLSSELSRPIKENFSSELAALLSSAELYEKKLDILRRYKNQEFFRIGVNDLQGRITTDEVSEQISRLAETILQSALTIAMEELRGKYGSPSNQDFFIIGMGKLGGRELIYGSDLDIFFAYAEDTGTDAAGTDAAGTGESTGPKVITDHEFFVRLAQRIISIISIKTSEGAAFEVDTRLRPSGSSGPLTISSTALLNYHRDKAQAWERQAALKARVVAGATGKGEEVIKELQGITAKRGLSPDDAQELLKIRARMEQEIAKEDKETLNIKLGSGGLVDIEFLSQALLMKSKTEKKAVKLKIPSTQAMLKELLDDKTLNNEQYQLLSESYGFYRLIETRLRIMQDNTDCTLYCANKGNNTSDKGQNKRAESTASLARRSGYSGKEAGVQLIKDYREKARQVRRIYLEIMKSLCEGGEK
ncbi:Glutamate-ammonia-ligase adenylyltransferase [hydrothermal vent metagenome]|uniref:Glutamate-ammonia-ligase adenylyltransferase n=1 Tax=hydrothermal vent metagenome TaxID=652676 RepID=A0A3B0QPY6_9ZZZZ